MAFLLNKLICLYLVGMKKLIPILLLFYSLSSFGQTYYPFPDSVGVWREVQYFGQAPTAVDYYSVYINGDTTINSNSYSKLYEYWSNTNLNIDTINSTYYGALRENNKKIYFYPDTNVTTPFYGNAYGFCYEWLNPNPNYSQDLLLYDFDVVIGDTVFYPHLDNMFIVINSIDSVLIQSQYRKKYSYSISLQGVCWGGQSGNYVEGIGDIQSGLFGLFRFYFENSNNFRCYEDDQVFYSVVSSCSSVGIEEVFNNNNFKIYPNPTSTNITIELIGFNNSFQAQLSLFDLTGKKVYTSSINSTINNIDVSAIKSGLYLLKIISDSGEIKSSLISIQ